MLELTKTRYLQVVGVLPNVNPEERDQAGGGLQWVLYIVVMTGTGDVENDTYLVGTSGDL